MHQFVDLDESWIKTNPIFSDSFLSIMSMINYCSFVYNWETLIDWIGIRHDGGP